MSKKRALLVAISEYNSNAISNLPVAERDVQALSSSLQTDSGYTVSLLQSAEYGSTGKFALIDALYAFFHEAEDGDLLILYFSCHGVNLDNIDYILPSDANPQIPGQFRERLISISDLETYSRETRASVVILFVDACREGLLSQIQQAKSPVAVGPIGGEHAASILDGTALVVVFSCSPGEFSRFPDEADGISHFTEALRHALSRSTKPRSLSEVIEYTNESLNQITKQWGHQLQRVSFRVDRAVSSRDPLDIEIAESPETPIVRAIHESPWCQMIERSSLWSDNDGTNLDGAREAFKRTAIGFTAKCWASWLEAKATISNDPWLDQDLPTRVLLCVEQIVDIGRLKLNGIELFLLVIAPFLNFTVTASGLKLLVEHGDALNVGPTEWKNEFRQAVQRMHSAMPQWVRRVVRLREQQNVGDGDTVAYWLAHLALFRSPELWHLEGSGWFPTSSTSAEP